jgi:hypothetical protein
MGMVNPSKFAGNANSTKSSGMIGVLVRIAAIRGIIEVGGTDPGDLRMWLKTDRTLHDETRGHLVQDAKGRDEATSLDVSPAATPPTNQTDSGHRAHGARAERKRLREPDKYLCDRMSESIESQHLGPFPTARPVVYSALQSLVDAKSNLAFNALIEAAIQKSRMEMADSPQPWSTIRSVTVRQLLGAGVALDEKGKPLPHNWSSGNVVVQRLAPDWVLRAEGEILLALFAAQDVTGDHLIDIARSVWGSSSADALSKVQVVLQALIDGDRVHEDDHGIFRVKRAPVTELPTHTLPTSAPATSGSVPVSGEKIHKDSDELIQ